MVSNLPSRHHSDSPTDLTRQQCGGQGYTGPTCCASGSVCTFGNSWYSQCLPGSAAPSSLSSSVQQPPTTSRTSSSSTRPVTSAVVSSSSNTPVITVTPTVSATATRSQVPGGASTTASFTGNPFEGVQLWANRYYSSEVHTLAIPTMTGAMATKAAAVAKVPSFQWLDRNVTIETLLVDTLGDIRKANQAGANPPYAAQIVVYNLPDRDCAAHASNGEFSIANNGANNYKNYVDNIRKKLIEYSDVRTILVIEPDSLANMVTNMGVAKCAGAASSYKELTKYTMKTLDLPHVAQYLDAGHAGWLGWPANMEPAAKLFADLYKDAGKPASVRGLATNVANYNSWSLTTAPGYTTPNPNFDEKRYVTAFRPLLEAQGFPAQFITVSLPLPHDTQSTLTPRCRTRAVPASSPRARSSGATGATPSAPASDPAPPPTRASPSRTPLSGSSPVASATAPATRRLPATTRSAACPTRSSPRPRPASGSRPTLSSCSPTPTLPFKRRTLWQRWSDGPRQ